MGSKILMTWGGAVPTQEKKKKNKKERKNTSRNMPSWDMSRAGKEQIPEVLMEFFQPDFNVEQVWLD